MIERYFSFEPTSYERTRVLLDSQWQYGPGTGTLTCVPPLAVAPRNSGERVVLAVWDAFLRRQAVADVLPSLLASGAVVEITRDDYWAAMPTGMP